MSKLASFAVGFGTGYLGQLDKNRRNEREDKRDAREEEEYQHTRKQRDRAETYQKDMAAAGQLSKTGASGIQGIGVQQDAQLAEQNASFANDSGQVGTSAGYGAKKMDETTFTNAKPDGDYFGAMAKVAAKHGKPEDVARFTQASEAEKAKRKEEERGQRRMALLQKYQASPKSLKDTLDFYSSAGAEDFASGGKAEDFAKINDRADKMKNEGLFDATQHYAATGDLAGTLDKFDAVGDKKIDRGTIKIEVVQDQVTQQKYHKIAGAFVGGGTFKFDPAEIAYKMGGYEAWKAGRKEAIDANDKNTDNKREDAKLGIEREKLGILRQKAAQEGGGGGGGANKQLSNAEMKTLFSFSKTGVKFTQEDVLDKDGFQTGEKISKPVIGGSVDRTDSQSMNAFIKFANGNTTDATYAAFIQSGAPGASERFRQKIGGSQSGASRPQSNAKPFNVNEFMRK